MLVCVCVCVCVCMCVCKIIGALSLSACLQHIYLRCSFYGNFMVSIQKVGLKDEAELGGVGGIPTGALP